MIKAPGNLPACGPFPAIQPGKRLKIAIVAQLPGESAIGLEFELDRWAFCPYGDSTAWNGQAKPKGKAR